MAECDGELRTDNEKATYSNRITNLSPTQIDSRKVFTHLLNRRGRRESHTIP